VSAPAPDARVAAAEQALARHGFAGARVRVEGAEGEIAAVRCGAGVGEALLGDGGRAAAEAVRATGFRYVALELDAD
jgi:hypothetical protein